MRTNREKGMPNKPPIKQVKKESMKCPPLCGLHCLLLEPGIQMDIDAGNHGKE